MMRYDENTSETGVRLEFLHKVKFHMDICLRCRGMKLSYDKASTCQLCTCSRCSPECHIEIVTTASKVVVWRKFQDSREGDYWVNRDEGVARSKYQSAIGEEKQAWTLAV